MSERIAIDSVRNAERPDILERRQMAGLHLPDSAQEPSSPIARTDLFGVALSGGGQRSACFCLGVVQCFFKTGLWRFTDYLSTVSGGGYLGGYVSSLLMKEQRVQTPENSPLMANSRTPQSADVQRFIYGGYSLMRPWELFNKYLIGVVQVNAALFSLIFGICALVAFLWRCMDYPFVRERLQLLDLDSDLLAPFWPFLLFAFAWLASWLISYARTGAEAPGKVAKRFLFLTVGAGLVALTLLLGNGDIGYGFGWSGRVPDNPTAPQGFATALIALVLGGLLPFLRPHRLIESGLKQNKRPLEKLIFNTASVALLIGVPLILIGLISREDISGYNKHRGRPLIKEDIDDWRGLLSLYVPRSENLTGNQALTATEFRRQVRRGSSLTSDEAAALQRTFRDSEVLQPNDAILERARPWLTALRDDSVPLPSVATFLSQRPKDPMVDQYAIVFALEEALRTEDRYRDMLYQTGRYRSFWATHYVNRVFHFGAWFLGIPSEPHTTPGSPRLIDGNPIARVWRAREVKEGLQDALCFYLNQELLASTKFPETLVGPLLAAQKLEAKDLTGASKTKASSAPDPTELKRLLNAASVSHVDRWLPVEKAELNRHILESQFPGVFRDRAKVRRRVAIYEDQKTRLFCAGISLGFFVLVGMWVDLNATSMHYYYRNRIQGAYLVPQTSKAPAWSLSKLHTTAYGGPYHLLSASVGSITQMFARSQGSDYARGEDASDIQRKRVFPFLFSRKFCGSESTGYLPTEEFESRVRGEMNQISLSEAVALSGAAVTPHNVQNSLVAFLMLVLNLRLGQWIPNPASTAPGLRPRVVYLLGSFLRRSLRPGNSEDAWYRFLTDGGYSDNLGLMPLLERRCRLIIAVDAGCDPAHRLDDLAHLMRIARVHHGIRFLEADPKGGPWRPDGLQLKKGIASAQSADGFDCPAVPLCDQHFSLARIQYPSTSQPGVPEPQEGLLIYIKPSVTGDESLDVKQYHLENQDFPHQSTSNQMYEQSQVEAYRQLGYHIAAELTQLLPPLTTDDMKLWDRDTARGIDVEQLCRWFTHAGLGWKTTTNTSTSTSTSNLVGSAIPVVEVPPAASAAEAPESRDNEASETSEAATPEEHELDVAADTAWNSSPSEATTWEPPTGSDWQSIVTPFPINVFGMPTAAEPVVARDLVTEDDPALRQWLDANEAQSQRMAQDPSVQDLIVRGLDERSRAATRVEILAKIGELQRIPKRLRAALRTMAASHPDLATRDSIRHALAKRSQSPK